MATKLSAGKSSGRLRPNLDPDAERALWLAFKSGSEDAKNRLANQYYALVLHCARAFTRRSPRMHGDILFDDLLSSGASGLMDAMEKFHPGRQLKFITYAKIRITGAIRDWLREWDHASRSNRTKVKYSEAVAERLANHLGRWPSISEIAKEAQLDSRKLSQAYEAVSYHESLDDIIEKSNNSDNPGYIFALRDGGSETPEEIFVREEMRVYALQLTKQSVRALTNRQQRYVASQIYLRGWTQERIGRAMGLTASRIAQIHSSALTEIRFWLTSHGITADILN